ncbi:hypothetical protein BJ508DRAFT_58593 [Ascobolus immersus RN42]|uniref:Uncharacterized protein n=1 Tax=Ascobolus immersus RN42 TaxID=1160509 RepID=A0A3N4HFI3_ASCIM|nr:hypothetical protein BJ508DRAFT_58593 [Ascobolus immersus RN42]
MQRIQSDFSVQQFSVPFSGHNIGISINRTRGSEPSADIIPEYDFFQQWGGFQFKCQGSYYNYTMDRVGDPDLSGIGVTISFLITSVFTLVLLLYGFRRHLIVDTFTNPFDKAVFHWLGSKTVHLSDSRKRMREKQAFQAALTALSDQQLVVGIAVLLAGISNCSLTIYGLRNLVAVTWLTAFVHLGTLLVVEKELRRNKPLRIIKAIAMLVMLVLIVYATVLYMFVDATTRGLQVQARYFYDHGVDRLGVGGIPSLSAFLDSNGFAVGDYSEQVLREECGFSRMY